MYIMCLISELFNARSAGVHLKRCVSPSVRPSVRYHLVKMLITLETFYILHHSAGNGQLAFHSLVLTPDTDSSTFTKGCAHYGQLILVYVLDIGKQRSTR